MTGGPDQPSTTAVAALLGDLGGRTLAIAETPDEGELRSRLAELGDLLVREGRTLPG